MKLVDEKTGSELKYLWNRTVKMTEENSKTE